MAVGICHLRPGRETGGPWFLTVFETKKAAAAATASIFRAFEEA
jgi:hypothetical protein